MGRAPADRTFYIPPEDGADLGAWSFDHTPCGLGVRNSSSEDVPGVSAINSVDPNKGRTHGPHCRRAGWSRVGVWLVDARLDLRGGVAPPATPAEVLLELWAINGETASRVCAATWTPGGGAPDPWPLKGGLLIGCAGVLAEGWELRAWVDNAVAGLSRPMVLHLRWTMDRGGGGFELLEGADTSVTTVDFGKA